MKDAYEVLDEIGISYKRYDHHAVYTVEESEKLDLGEGVARCKNLFLRDRKKQNYYLVILLDKKRVDLKKMAEKLDAKKLSFASEDDLKKYLDVTPGSVSAFSLSNNTEKNVKVFIDSDLSNFENVSFHPNINTTTLVFSFSDFEKFMKWSENEFSFINFN